MVVLSVQSQWLSMLIVTSHFFCLSKHRKVQVVQHFLLIQALSDVPVRCVTTPDVSFDELDIQNH